MAKKDLQNTPEPNIAFVGEKDGKQPLLQIHNGDTTIILPEDQSKPFYHAEAKTIVRLFRYLYKPVIQK
jgi:hypothetical protein